MLTGVVMQSPVVAEDEKGGDKTLTGNVLELQMSAAATQTTRKAKVRTRYIEYPNATM